MEPIRITFNSDARSVYEFVEICQELPYDIDVYAGRYIVDGASLMGVMAICTMPDICTRILEDSPVIQEKFRDKISDFIVREE